ncbi:unnamed protein product [Phytomonas sp. EM1]|nr:unnamed protein product [Phytomonas sp. EM1]|eukprot:CCW63643.1 unnamed protein product [Phytomonas sp. isolate EM1]
MAEAVKTSDLTPGRPRFGPGRARRVSPRTTASSAASEARVGANLLVEDPLTAMPRRYPLLDVLPFSSVVEQRYGWSSTKGEKTSSSLCGSASSVSLGVSCDDEKTLRSLIWGGCRPEVLRAAAWRLLLGYTPPSISRQGNELRRKRMMYEEYIHQYIQLSEVEEYITNISAQSVDALNRGCKRSPARMDSLPNPAGGGGVAASIENSPVGSPFPLLSVTTPRCSTLISHEKAIISQIALDLPRHRASVYHCRGTLASMARSLFLWSQRHPAVGYVQGMDDILGVFFQIFLADGLRQYEGERNTAKQKEGGGEEPAEGDVALQQRISSSTTERALQGWGADTLHAALQELPQRYLLQIEADTYWCTSRMLSLLQDNYVPGQIGLFKCATHLETILAKADPELMAFLNEGGVRLFDSCFQWLHCLLVRELPLPLLLRLWDTYFAVGDENLLHFHIFVCAAFVVNLRQALLGSPMDLAIQILRNPFEYAKFPVFAASSMPRSGKFSEEDSQHSPVVEKPVDTQKTRRSTSHAASTTPMVSQELSEEENLWLDIIIADAYRLWRQYPLI